MDRSKWEYKKLGDCFVSIGNGATIKQIKEAMGIPITRIETLSNDVFNRDRLGYANIEDASPYSSYILNDGDILMSHINSMKFLGRAVEYKKLDNEVIIHGMNLLRLVPTPDFLSSYAVYQFQTDFFRKQIKAISHQAVNQASFNVTNLKRLNVLVPTLEDQQRIVAELDCLNEMIAVKQEQLKEFDKLAQSIFYDMFGDPVSNEKGWDIIELGTKCEVTSFKRVLIEEVVDSGIPFIRGTELMALSKATKGEQIDFSLFITPEHYERVKTISGVPKVGDLLIPSINSDGNIWILDTDEPRYYKDGRVLWVHVNHDAFSSEALKYIMHILLKKTYSLMATGATFAELKLFVLRELKVPLPPLELQQQFAEKISAIEAQKELVKQSIAETQHLLDFTMDKYFG